MCQQDAFSATLYTQTTGLLSSIWDTAATLFAPSQARWQSASEPQQTPPRSHTIPAGSALSCPWAVGVGHTACILGGEGTRASWFLSRKLSVLSAKVIGLIIFMYIKKKIILNWIYVLVWWRIDSGCWWKVTFISTKLKSSQHQLMVSWFSSLSIHLEVS